MYSNAASWVAYATSGTTVNAGVIGDANAHWIWSSGICSQDTTVLFRSANVVNTAATVP